MEDILEIYGSECPENTVRLCFDERPCQLIEEVYTPMRIQEGKAKRIDCEYQRNGTASLLLAYDIDKGERFGQLRDRRTKRDFSEFFDWIEKKYPDATKLIVILDNLNTHNYGAFYENLPIKRAAFLRQKIELHFTPKHGSWINMVEIEFSALSRQCLSRRIGSKEEMEKEISIWEQERNEKKIKISWSFTVPKARDTMASKYIKINNYN